MMNLPYQPLVSIITVNYNTTSVTIELLKSLQQITYTNVEIIVIDNASQENCDAINTHFPAIKFLKNTVNEGFAGGNNRGIEIAKGEIIFLINNDTEVKSDFLEPVVELFNQNSKIGIISSKLIYFDCKDTIQYAGGNPINSLTSRGTFIGTGEKDINQYPNAYKTYLAHGAAMAIHRKVINTIGLLPEMYFLYYEELDFSVHALRAGFEIWFQPLSVVYHKESMSVGKLSGLKVYYRNRSRLLFIRRNIFGFKGLVSKLFYIFIAAPFGIIKFILSGKINYAKMILKGIWWNFLYKIK